MTNARQKGELIGLKLHASTTPITQLAARKLVRDVLAGNGNTCGHVFDRGDECLSVRFAGSYPSKHVRYCLTKPGASASMGAPHPKP